MTEKCEICGTIIPTVKGSKPYCLPCLLNQPKGENTNCSICGEEKAVQVNGTYWLCGPCVFDNMSKLTPQDAMPPETEKLEHEESENCWCCPTVEEYKNGKVIIHNEEN